MNDVARQLRRQVCQLVGIHFLRCGKQFVIVHIGDQRFPNCVGHLEQDIAVSLGLDQLPDGQSLFER